MRRTGTPCLKSPHLRRLHREACLLRVRGDGRGHDKGGGKSDGKGSKGNGFTDRGFQKGGFGKGVSGKGYRGGGQGHAGQFVDGIRPMSSMGGSRYATIPTSRMSRMI